MMAPIADYLAEMRQSLRTDARTRDRILAEIQDHLLEGFAAELDRSVTDEEAANNVVARFGPPRQVAGDFMQDFATDRLDQNKRELVLALPLFVGLIMARNIVQLHLSAAANAPLDQSWLRGAWTISLFLATSCCAVVLMLAWWSRRSGNMFNHDLWREAWSISILSGCLVMCASLEGLVDLYILQHLVDPLAYATTLGIFIAQILLAGISMGFAWRSLRSVGGTVALGNGMGAISLAMTSFEASQPPTSVDSKIPRRLWRRSLFSTAWLALPTLVYLALIMKYWLGTPWLYDMVVGTLFRVADPHHLTALGLVVLVGWAIGFFGGPVAATIVNLHACWVAHSLGAKRFNWQMTTLVTLTLVSVVFVFLESIDFIDVISP